VSRPFFITTPPALNTLFSTDRHFFCPPLACHSAHESSSTPSATFSSLRGSVSGLLPPLIAYPLLAIIHYISLMKPILAIIELLPFLHCTYIAARTLFFIPRPQSPTNFSVPLSSPSFVRREILATTDEGRNPTRTEFRSGSVQVETRNPSPISLPLDVSESRFLFQSPGCSISVDGICATQS